MQNDIQFLKWCSNDDLDIQITLDNLNIPVRSLDSNKIILLSKKILVQNPIQQKHKEWLKAGSLEKANLIKDDKKIYFNHYGAIAFGNPVDWGLGQPGQDNLSWQLHSLFLLRDLIAAHESTSDESYIDLVISFIASWTKFNVTKDFPSSFSWNDHSTAFRLFAFTNVLIYFFNERPNEAEFIRFLLALVVRHQKILADDNFYSKGTNHGLDQSYYLYFSCTALLFTNASHNIKGIAFDRLQFEVTKSFASDGVHIENSPEYHDIILNTVLEINRFVFSVESVNLVENYEEFSRNALKFLVFILRPDGCFPPLGDSVVILPRNNYNILSHLPGYNELCYVVSQGSKGYPEFEQHAAFPTSGYFIMRSDAALLPPPDRVHIVYKCGFLSQYHRQDDDNNILVFAHGEEWLTDGGLYKHDNTDPQRAHLRSHYAHNVMAPEGIKAERQIRSSISPKILDYSLESLSASVKGETPIFKGFLITREVFYDGQYNFEVCDSAVKVDSSRECGYFEQYWQIPQNKEINIKSNKIVVKSTHSDWFLQMSISSGDLIKIEEIIPSNGSYFCWKSSQYNTLEPVKVIKVVYTINKSVTKSSTKFQWKNNTSIMNKNLYIHKIKRDIESLLQKYLPKKAKKQL